MSYNEAHKQIIDDLVLGMPGVKGGKAFGYPAYKVNGKVFAFVGESGIAIKLPEARVNELLDIDPSVKPFEVSDGSIWREWAFIERETSSDYRQDITLLEESAEYVASKG
jgi:hypothetical protein